MGLYGKSTLLMTSLLCAEKKAAKQLPQNPSILLQVDKTFLPGRGQHILGDFARKQIRAGDAGWGAAAKSIAGKSCCMALKAFSLVAELVAGHRDPLLAVSLWVAAGRAG